MKQLTTLVFLTLISVAPGAYAQNKVVVIPMAADAQINTGLNNGDVLGYVIVNSVGTVLKSWMATGGTPTVTHNVTGKYEITWPGESFSILDQNAQATINSASPHFIALDSIQSKTLVHTHDASGNPSDPFAFSVTLFQDDNP